MSVGKLITVIGDSEGDSPSINIRKKRSILRGFTAARSDQEKLMYLQNNTEIVLAVGETILKSKSVSDAALKSAKAAKLAGDLPGVG